MLLKRKRPEIDAFEIKRTNIWLEIFIIKEGGPDRGHVTGGGREFN